MAKWFEDEGFANKICKLVYDNYKRLGKKGKPLAGREWTILAAVVAVFDNGQQNGAKIYQTIMNIDSLCPEFCSMAVNSNCSSPPYVNEVVWPLRSYGH